MYYRIFLPIYNKAAQKMCLDCHGFINEGDKILDLGCGSGIIAKNFQNSFKGEVLGVDVKDQRIFPISFKIINGKFLPFDNNIFDVVLINYVLHHSQNPESLLKEAKRVAKRIIIYEDLPRGLLSKLMCFFHQVTYNPFFRNKNQKFNFKSEEGWKNLFESLELRLIYQKNVSTPFDFFYPVHRVLFVLDKI